MGTNYKYVSAWERDKYLRQHGVELLTGEACGLGMRILCDLSESAALHIGAMLGGAVPSAPNWNSGAAKSMLIPRSLLPDIVVYFMLALEGYEVAQVTEDGAVMGMSMDLWKQEYRDKPRTHAYFRDGTARSGLRNLHEASGRVE